MIRHEKGKEKTPGEWNPLRGLKTELINTQTTGSLTVIADRLDGATLHGLGTGGKLLISDGLLLHIRNALVIIASEEVGSRLPAQIAVNAIAIDVELSGNIFLVFFINISHNVQGVS